MKRLIRLLNPSIKSIAAVMGVGCVSGACHAGILALINQRLAGEPPGILGFSLMFLALLLMLVSLNLTAKWTLLELGNQTSYRLRTSLAHRILSMDLRKLEMLGHPRIYAALADDVTAVWSALIMVPTFCISATVLLGCLVYLGWLSMMIFWILAAFSVPSLSIHFLLMQTAKRLTRETLGKRDQVFEAYRTLSEGVKELKLHRPRRFAFLQDVFSLRLLEFNRLMTRHSMAYEAASTWTHSMYFLFIFSLFLTTTWLDATPQALTGYALVALFMMGHVRSLMNSLPSWYRANVALKELQRVGLLIDTPSPQAFEESECHTQGSFQSLELRDVHFRYETPDERHAFTLGPLTLSFFPGEITFVCGGNGSGKTTLLKLLTGLYTPNSGRIALNGKPIQPETRGMLSPLFSVVFSQVFVFEQLLGLDMGGRVPEAEKWLSRLQLKGHVHIIDGRFSTTHLSHGQQKRLALFTALMEDRPILVLDEWAAGQDPEFKTVFYMEILPCLKSRGKLVVAMTHDDHYFHTADRIIWLRDGNVDQVVTPRVDCSNTPRNQGGEFRVQL